jgi:hypothetical protein
MRVVESRFLFDWFAPPFNTTRAAKFRGFYGPFSEFEDDPWHVSFSGPQQAEGEQLMREIGLEPGAPFVCVHWRDNAYYDQVNPEDGRATTYRNTRTENMLPALRELARRGVPVLRMGARAEEPLPEAFLSEHPNVVDYARRFRTDLGDIFLTANCELFVGTNSGLVVLAQAFNRPLSARRLSQTPGDAFPNKQLCRHLQNVPISGPTARGMLPGNDRPVALELARRNPA